MKNGRSRALCIVPRLAAVAAVSLAGLLLVHGTAFAAVAQQVQSGTVANAANGVQIVNISAIDPAKSFLIFEARSNSNRPVASSVRGRIPIACANPCATIEFERLTDEGTPATINIQWYVVTFVTGVESSGAKTPYGSSRRALTRPCRRSTGVRDLSKSGSRIVGGTDDAIGADHQHDQSAVPSNEAWGNIITFRGSSHEPADIKRPDGGHHHDDRATSP